MKCLKNEIYEKWVKSVQIFNETCNEKRNNALCFYVSAYRKKVRQILKANIQRKRGRKRKKDTERERNRIWSNKFISSRISLLNLDPFFLVLALHCLDPYYRSETGDLNHYYDVSLYYNDSFVDAI